MKMTLNGVFKGLDSFHLAVDETGAKERAASLASRSIKKSSKLFAIKLAASMIDLTTLEGKDSEGKVLALCRKAISPMEGKKIFRMLRQFVCTPILLKQLRKRLKAQE